MRYGLIGEHLGHSYSREIHEKLAPFAYEIKELAPDEVADFIQGRAFDGINVTIPYKETVMPYLDEISPRARAIGSVNTVIREGERLVGDNTDLFGMQTMLASAGIDLRGKKVMILGTGGTSKTAAAVAREAGAQTVLIVSRIAGDGRIDYESAYREHADAEVLINTTPVGMYPKNENIPIDITRFPGLCGVADAVYNPLRTRLVQAAMDKGIPACGGLTMLVAQAVLASSLFHHQAPEFSRIAEITREMEREKGNIVLIGMPSCGKTTVGGILAARLGKRFVDTDEEIVKIIGMPIPAYFARYGEAAFREVEAKVVSELAKIGGQVIATGGGAVLREENVTALRANGRLCLLDRSLALLTPTDDRPLSSKKEALAALFASRMPRYCAIADLRVNGDGTPQQVAETLIQELMV